MFCRAEAYNRRAAAPEFKANEVVRNLGIQNGSVIADIGSGGGFFTMKFAAETGLDGRVYAVDVNEKNLAHVKRQAEERELGNVETVLLNNSENLSGLPLKAFDLAFLRNVCHHIAKPESYFNNLKPFLKNDGKVAIIDYKKNNRFAFINLFDHYLEEEYIIDFMGACNYKHIVSYDFIETQSFNIFQVRESL
ncbi:MAG: class I SAM-dependent methyltransferase [Spirochaetales bacterium]|nr:class I SAM-dependent methyltransferase [Spirochaetales bacterium]